MLYSLECKSSYFSMALQIDQLSVRLISVNVAIKKRLVEWQQERKVRLE